MRKRGTAVTVPTWDPEKCVQCNNCAFVCSHATIRPFLLTEDEVSAAPSNIKVADDKSKKTSYKFAMSVSPLDCMGCGECITVCPAEGAIKMVPQAEEADEQPVFDYLVANVGKKDSGFADTTPKGSQYNQPLLEFSGSCAGCAETSYARLVTQLFGEQMYISNATGCSSIWGNPAATSPYTVNKDSKKGPAWSNSLFEDNAEHGLGMHIGQKYLRDQAIESVKACAASDKASAELKAAADKFVETRMIQKLIHLQQRHLSLNLKRQQQLDVLMQRLLLTRRITLLRSLYGFSVVMDGHMISVSVDLTMYLHQVRM